MKDEEDVKPEDYLACAMIAVMFALFFWYPFR